LNPDVVSAIARLEHEGVFTAETAAPLLRVARGDVVSLRKEIRFLLYGGVLLVTTGAGLLVAENRDRIGPVALALILGTAVLGCLLWVARHAAAFSWGEAPAPHLAFDYVLLLGVCLLGLELAYLETQFTPLGASWPFHLLAVSFVTGLLAVRYDSRIVFALALSSLAAWRGVSASTLERTLWFADGGDAVRSNALLCGALFVLLGLSLPRMGRKAHFGPVASHLGWMLVLGALASGTDTTRDRGLAFGLALFVTGAILAVVSFRRRRFSLYALGVLGSYWGLSACVLRGVTDGAAFLWFVLTAIGILVGLLVTHHLMGEPA
jgi:hypothetical protein